MKRRNTDEGEGGLDSLLDTMTNVVGILVIVLVVTQLGVGEAVKRITDSIQIDAAQLAEAEKRLAELKAERDALLAAMADEQPDDDQDYEQRLQQIQQQIAQQQRVLDQLKAEELARKTELENKLKSVTDPKQREKEINEARQKVAKLTDEWETKDVELERLRQLLAETPEQPVPPPKEITLPDPKPAPEGAKQLTIVCANNKVYLVPDPLLLEQIRKAARTRAAYLAQRQRGFNPAAGEGVEKFIKEFNERPIQDQPYKYFDIKLYNSNGYPRLMFYPREAGGEDERVVTGPLSRFQKILSSVNKNMFYIRFYVCTDSFDIYVTTRRVVSDKGLLAGWVPQSTNWRFTTHLGGELHFGPKPKPKPKPPVPDDKPPPKPPNVID